MVKYILKGFSGTLEAGCLKFNPCQEELGWGCGLGQLYVVYRLKYYYYKVTFAGLSTGIQLSCNPISQEVSIRCHVAVQLGGHNLNPLLPFLGQSFI